MRRFKDNKLADDGGQILKFHMERHHPQWSAICRLFTWRSPNAPVQRTSLAQLKVPEAGKGTFPMPHLQGSDAAVAGRKELEQSGCLTVPRRICLQGEAASPDGSSQAVGLHGVLLPVAELLQVPGPLTWLGCAAAGAAPAAAPAPTPRCARPGISR